MTYDEKVKYLKSYKDKYCRWIYIDNQILGVKGITFEERSGSAPKKSKIDYIEEKTRIENELKEIQLLIDNIEDERMRFVLDYRFIQFHSLEEIADIMGYSLTWVKDKYKKGINCVLN